MFRSLRTATTAALLSVLGGGAAAETTLCTEIVPPTVISSPGSYCLLRDYALNLPYGAAIGVTANNVVIDFNGHRIGNLAAGPTNVASGVATYANFAYVDGIQNLTVRNGTIRGFSLGVDINSTGGIGHLVEDMLIDQSVWMGVRMISSRSIIRHNRVVGTGTLSAAGSKIGIYAGGVSNVVLDNDVADTVATAARSTAIYTTGASATVIGNRVSGMVAGGTDDEYGIQAYSNGGIVNNNMVYDDAAPTGTGITYGVSANAPVVIVNNVVKVVGTAYAGGTPIAGTNH